MINSSVVGLGILLAAVSGLMNGTFTLPMRYLVCGPSWVETSITVPRC
jgi:hypothetical protein